MAAGRNFMQYRILGGNGSNERIGAGFMVKDIGRDNDDSCPPDFSIVYILSGKGRYIDHRGRSHFLNQGDYFIRFTDCRHTNIIDPGADWYELFLAFGPQQGKAFMDMGFVDPDRPVGFIGEQPSIIERVTGLCTQLQKAGQNEIPYIFKSMTDIFFDMLEINNLGKKTRDSVILIERISEYIADNLQERFSIEEISRRFGLSASKLRKDFKQVKGISIGNYLIRKRIEASFKLLGDSGLSVGEIAEKLGYKSIYDFSNQFKKFTSHSPSYYRKRI